MYRLSYVDLKCWMGNGKSHQGIELVFRMQTNEVWEGRLKAKFPFSGDSNFLMTVVKSIVVFKHFTDCGTQCYLNS